jgi:hypothetical protein
MRNFGQWFGFIVFAAAFSFSMTACDDGIAGIVPGNNNFIAVRNITGVPSGKVAGASLALSGIAVPANATNRTIVWSVQNAGVTGATIDGDTLNTRAAGTVTVRATITNGLTPTSNYTQNFNITVSAVPGVEVAFNNLTANGFSGEGFASIPAHTTTLLTLTFDRDIDGLAASDITLTPGFTGAVRGALTRTRAGTYTLGVSGIVAAGDVIVTVSRSGFNVSPASRAVRVNHLTGSSPPMFIPATNITRVPTTAIVGIPLILSGTVVPSNATNRAIAWGVLNGMGTGATISGNTLNTTSAGTVFIRATIFNGATATTNYTQDFAIVVSASPSFLSAPTGLDLFTGSPAMLSWSAVSGATGYDVYRRNPGEYQFNRIATVSTTFIYIDMSNLPAGRYYYYVTAFNSDGESLPSNVISFEIPGNGGWIAMNLFM